jgi:hypothetical protein
MINPGRRNTLIDFIAVNFDSLMNYTVLTYFNIFYCVYVKNYIKCLRFLNHYAFPACLIFIIFGLLIPKHKWLS